MSGNQPPDPPSGNPPEFPLIGQYELVPSPGEEGYVDPAEPEADPEADDDFDDQDGDYDDGPVEDFEEETGDE